MPQASRAPKRFYCAVIDSWALAVGANVFAGADAFTFFDQFGLNTDVFAALRSSF